MLQSKTQILELNSTAIQELDLLIVKKIMSILFCVPCFFACHYKGGHPIACFTVTNPVMALGDTVRIELCYAKNSRDGEWNMGDTTYRGGSPPRHVYKAKGTYTIKLKSYEHMGGGKMFSHWQKQVISEAQQIVTIQ